MAPRTVSDLIQAYLEKNPEIHTERDAVKLLWEKFSDEERKACCRLCTSYFPENKECFECLSDHGTRYSKPCPSFSRAVFRLCDDWSYTPKQVFVIRELEAACRRTVGMDADDDEFD